jgi:hypothetical protein
MVTPCDDLVLSVSFNQGLMYNSPLGTPRTPVKTLVEDVRRQLPDDRSPFQRAFLFLAPSPGQTSFRL